MSLRRSALLAALPVLAGAAALLLGEGGGRGRLQAGVAMMLAAAACGALARGSARQALARLAAAAPAAGLLLLAVGCWPAQALAGAALVAASGACALGLAALGRALGSGPVAAGLGAGCVCVAALTGLWWADPVSEAVPHGARFAWRQAVLDLDLATAFAYDVAGLDRLLEADVYGCVPLASSSVRRPVAARAALAWGALGAACLLGAAGLGRARRGRAGAAGGGAVA